MRNVVLIACTTLYAAEAKSACPAGAVEDALVARVDFATVQALEGVLITELTTDIPVPHNPIELWTCGTSPRASAAMTNGSLSVTVESTAIDLEPDAVRIRAELSLAGSADAEFQFCGGPGSCQAHFSAERVHLSARVVPDISDCELGLGISEMTIDVQPIDVDLTVSECGPFESLIEQSYETLREQLLTLAMGELQILIDDMVPPLVETFTTDLVLPAFEMNGLRVDAALHQVQITPDGATIHFMANATSTDGLAECNGAAEIPEEPEEAQEDATFSAAPISMALSQRMITRVTHAGWQAGWLCFDSEQYDLKLGEVIAPLIDGADLRARIHTEVPPRVVLDPGATAGVRLGLQSVKARLDLELPGTDPIDIRAEVAARMWARVAVDSQTSALVTAPTRVETDELSVALPDAALMFRPERIDSLMRDKIMPLLADESSNLAVAIGLMQAAPIAVRLDATHVRGTYVRADFNIWEKDPNDHSAPTTLFAAPPPVVAGAHFLVDMASFDDHTPLEFMRHWVAIDGESELFPRLGRRLDLTLKPGLHRVRISAVDLNDNMDAAPLEVEVYVDRLAPFVEIIGAPKGVTTATQLEVRVSARDNASALEQMPIEYRVSTIGRVAEEDYVLDSGFLLDSRLALRHLPEDTIIRVEAWATDTAGNVGRDQVAFSVNRQPTLDCSAASGALWWVVAFSLVPWWRRRRRS